jgi:hypothetical protein
MAIRPLTIRSRYQDAECTACGATITLDFGPEGYDGDPIEITTADDHNDDCPQAPVTPATRALSIQVRQASGDLGFFAYIPTNDEHDLTLGLVYGKTRFEAAGKMFGMLDQMGLLKGRTLPIVFVD